MNGLGDDIWMALTRLLRDWRYTFAASICLAAGTAAVISVFTIVNLVVLKPLPFHEPDRLVMIRGFCPIENEDDAQTSVAEFLDWQTQCTTMELAGSPTWASIRYGTPTTFALGFLRAIPRRLLRNLRRRSEPRSS